MLLMAAVVQIEDAPALSERLLDQGLRLTKINSTGGLFGTDSVALLLGLDETRYDDVVQAIEATCKTRNVHMSSVAMLDPTFLYLTPMEVEVGGAVVFCVPVERFVHLPEGVKSTPHTDFAGSSASSDSTSAEYAAAEPAHRIDQAHHADQEETNVMSEPISISQADPAPTQPADGDERMKLIVAIVKANDADNVIRALLSEGHRLTRINTTGGFLRRGNATLLIGVKASQVDTIINLMESACPQRGEASPLEKGLPEYSANVFVLDTSHFVRV